MLKASYCFVHISFCSSSQLSLVIKSGSSIQLGFKVKSNTHSWRLPPFPRLPHKFLPTPFTFSLFPSQGMILISLCLNTQLRRTAAPFSVFETACKVKTRSLWLKVWRIQDGNCRALNDTEDCSARLPMTQACRQGLVREIHDIRGCFHASACPMMAVNYKSLKILRTNTVLVINHIATYLDPRRPLITWMFIRL